MAEKKEVALITGANRGIGFETAKPMEIPEGGKASVAAALLGPDGPSGRFIHLGQELPW